MNRVDGVAKIVRSDRRFDLLVSWVGLSRPRGPEGAAVRPGVAGVTCSAGGVRRRSWRSFARLDHGASWACASGSRWERRVGGGDSVLYVGRGEAMANGSGSFRCCWRFCCLRAYVQEDEEKQPDASLAGLVRSSLVGCLGWA